MSRIGWIAVGVVTVAVGAIGVLSASSEPYVESMPNCPERWNISADWGPNDEGYGTPIEAAEEVRQAIVAGGGRENGRAVEELVSLDELTFYIPIPDTAKEDADGLIRVEEAPKGGYLATSVSFCAGTVPDPFPWGLEG